VTVVIKLFDGHDHEEIDKVTVDQPQNELATACERAGRRVQEILEYDGATALIVEMQT
jgi:predicted membrane GTPase involved in stress response